MKKFLIALIVLILSVSVIIGCGQATTTQPTTPGTVAPGAPMTGTLAPGSTQQPATPTKAAPSSAAPAKTTAAVKGPVYGGVLRYIMTTAPSTSIGIPWESGFGHGAQGAFEDGWVKYMADGSFASWLANVENNPDPKNPSHTFKFQKGIKFHDGTDLNAQVVKWSWDKIVASGLYASVRYYKSLDIVDDYTVKTPLVEWRNSQLFAFSASQHYIISPTNLEKKGTEAIRFNICSTGPFKQVEFNKDVSMRGVRFDYYWQTGKPYLQGVQFLFVADELTRVALFKTGGAEVMDLAGNGRIASELKKDGWNIEARVSGATVMYPDSANADSPWSNLKVRQAAEYALDKENIAKAFGFGYFTAATQIPSPTAPSYNKELPVRKYDPEKAKALLKEAGFPNGFKTKIIAQSGALNMDVCVAIQNQYKQVGIEVDLDFVEPLKFLEYQMKGWKNALLFTNFGMEGNPIPAIGFTFPPVRTGRFEVVKNPPGWEEVYNKSATTPTVEPAWLQKYTSEIFNDVMIIPIYWNNALYALSPKVHDIGLNKYGVGDWDKANTWLSP